MAVIKFSLTLNSFAHAEHHLSSIQGYISRHFCKETSFTFTDDSKPSGGHINHPLWQFNNPQTPEFSKRILPSHISLLLTVTEVWPHYEHVQHYASIFYSFITILFFEVCISASLQENISWWCILDELSCQRFNFNELDFVTLQILNHVLPTSVKKISSESFNGTKILTKGYT